MVAQDHVKAARQVIREWLEHLPPDTVTLSQESLEFEHVVRIEPRNEGSSSLELRIGKHCGTFDVNLGQGTQFDDLHFDRGLLLEILQAVQNGRLRERNLIRRGKVILTKGDLQLARGTWSSNRAVLWWSLLRLLPPRPRSETICYEPYR